MAVFNKKGGGAAGSGPLRWLPVGQNFNLLRLMFQAPGSPSGPFKNPAYKSYIAKISNEPLDFLLPDRSIVSARCVWIISGGRPSQHGFHLVVLASGRENLQRLSGQEGVSSRHFSAELIADAAKADASERTGVPRSATGVTIKPKPKPVSKPVDDFSDLSGDSDGASSSPASFLDEAPVKPSASKAPPKPKTASTDLASDDFLSGPDSGMDVGMGSGASSKEAATDLSDLDGSAGTTPASDDLDFQSYKGAAPAKPAAVPAAKAAKALPAEDNGFLSDGADDLMTSTPGGRTWSLDDDLPAAQQKLAEAVAPAEEPASAAPGDDLLEAPAAEAPAEPEMPEEPVAAQAAPAATADDNPFEADLPGGAAGGMDTAAQSAPPIEAEAIPEDDPFADFDKKPEAPVAPPAAAPEPAAAASAENPFDEFGGEPQAAPSTAAPAGDDMFEDHPAATAAPVSAPPAAESAPAAPEASAMAAEALKEELAPAPAVVAESPVVAAPADETPGWDFSDDSHGAPKPAAEPPAAPEPVSVPEPVPAATPLAAAPAAAADEEPVAMDEFAADEMAARVAGETDDSDLITPAAQAPASVPTTEPVAPVSAPPAAAASVSAPPAQASVDGEPMFADETEAALGEVEDMVGPEALMARARKSAPPQAGASGELQNAYAHDDVAYFADLPKDAVSGSSDILSAEARRLASQAQTPAASTTDADEVPVAMTSRAPEPPAASVPPGDKIAELRAKGAPVAFEDEAVAVGDEVSDAEDLFGDRKKVSKLDTNEFPHEAGNGRDHDSVQMADLRYTNLNTDADTAKAIAEADSIMSAEEFFKDEVAAVNADGSAAGSPAEPESPAPAAAEPPSTVISGPPEPELVAKPPSEPPAVQAAAAPAEAPARPEGAWRKFTGDVSTELKNKAKQAKIVERAPDMIRFDLKVRVLWPEDGLTEGTLCVKDRAPSVWLSAADIRKITPEAEVEF